MKNMNEKDEKVILERQGESSGNVSIQINIRVMGIVFPARKT